MGEEVELKEHISNLKEPFQDEDNFAILNDNIKNPQDVEMSITVKDEESIDIKRTERYWDEAAWMVVLKLIEKN